MRRCFDEIWIIDLGGDSLGTRREPNVFAIQTPVTIAIGIAAGAGDWDTPAPVRYHRIGGSRLEKFQQLEELVEFTSVEWRLCPAGWMDPFRPALEGDYATWPKLQQLLPWRHNGAQFTRTWPIAATTETLEQRWRMLIAGDAASRKLQLKESRDRTIDWQSKNGVLPGIGQPCVRALAPDAPSPAPIRYAYRSFDRQWALYDARLGDYLKPPIWAAHGPNQIYLSTLLATPIGYGPAATACADVPDLHHFRGSFGGKDMIPLYRDAEAGRPNVNGGVVTVLGSSYASAVSGEDLFAYTAGLLCTRAFPARFWTELATPGIRVPVTRDAGLFREVAAMGRQLIRLHSFGERFRPDGEDPVALGSARLESDIPHTSEAYPQTFEYIEESARLNVGRGVLGNVSAEVFGYEVSGLRVIRSWLSYRMQSGAGRTSSPLDKVRPRVWTARMTDELLQLIWTLEAVLGKETEARDLLKRVVEGPLFAASDFRQPTPAELKEPQVSGRGRGPLF